MHSAAELLMRDVEITSAGKLIHRDVLRAIIDAAMPDQEDALFTLAFKAKFLVRTWSVMQRLGKDDPARVQLKQVFTEELELVRAGIRALLASVDEEMRDTVERDMLALDGASFVRMLELLRDVAWVQNVKIDRSKNAM